MRFVIKRTLEENSESWKCKVYQLMWQFSLYVLDNELDAQKYFRNMRHAYSMNKTKHVGNDGASEEP